LITSLDQIATDTRVDAIVNLAGEPIASGLWTRAKRAQIIGSRVATTEAIVGLIARLAVKPRVLINGSAIGWYGLWQDESLDEASPGLDCFSHQLCAAWEEAARKAEVHSVRVVLLRIGLVLGTEGGMLARFLTPFEFALGGPMGSGRQWMSWIDRDDLVRLISHALAKTEIRGPLNATAPEPVTNSDFTRALARALHRPACLPAPAALLSMIGGDLARELMLGGQKVLPKRALATGFVFDNPTLVGALDAMLGARRAAVPRRTSTIVTLTSSSGRPVGRAGTTD
jgi:uncharacterized protein (TIGR01777 family)